MYLTSSNSPPAPRDVRCCRYRPRPLVGPDGDRRQRVECRSARGKRQSVWLKVSRESERISLAELSAKLQNNNKQKD